MGYELFTRKSKQLEEIVKFGINNVLSIPDSGYSNYTVFNIKAVGRVLEGEAYYHEVDQYYRCIGLEVEAETQFSFQDKPQMQVGFYSVWMGKSRKCAPFTFEESYRKLGQAYSFDNGMGDKIEVLNELATIDQVQKILTENNLSITNVNS